MLDLQWLATQSSLICETSKFTEYRQSFVAIIRLHSITDSHQGFNNQPVSPTNNINKCNIGFNPPHPSTGQKPKKRGTHSLPTKHHIQNDALPTQLFITPVNNTNLIVKQGFHLFHYINTLTYEYVLIIHEKAARDITLP